MREITDATFEQEVLAASRPVVVDFWAPWCGPCKAIEPLLEELAARVGDAAEFVRVNVDENYVAASRLGVLSLPTVIVFAGGEPQVTLIGARSKRDYERLIGAWVPIGQRVDRSEQTDERAEPARPDAAPPSGA